MPSPVILGAVALVCCLVLAAAIYFSTQSSGSPSGSSPSGSSPSGSPSGSPAPAPAATDPRQAVWSSGQSIQSAPLEISTTTTNFATAPTGITTTSAPSYTMSMDINIAQTGPSWRNVFNNGSHDCCDANARHPAMFITGSDASPPNRIHIVHNASEDVNRNIVSNFAATLGQWFNVTFVVNGGVMSTYFNGVADATVSGTFNWGSQNMQWRWNEYIQEYTTRTQNTQGSVQVANVYFWNSALTASQIAQLKIPSAPTPGVSTTSYFVPEPYSLD